MKDKLGLYVSNLMATIIDDDERNFSRKLALNELQKINVFISNLFYKIINISKTKNSFYLEGKISLKNSDFMTRTDSLFSDRFIAFWNYINKNSIDNPEIHSFKEYAESSNLYDENGDSKLSRRSIKNNYFKTKKDIFIVNKINNQKIKFTSKY